MCVYQHWCGGNAVRIASTLLYSNLDRIEMLQSKSNDDGFIQSCILLLFDSQRQFGDLQALIKANSLSLM